MNRLPLPLLLLLLVACAGAAEPLLTVQVPDPKRTAERLERSRLGRVLATVPAHDPRRQVRAMLGIWAQRLRLPAGDLADQARDLAFELHGVRAEQGSLRLSARAAGDLGPHATAVADWLTGRIGAPTSLPGADQAAASTSGRTLLARYGTRVVVASEPALAIDRSDVPAIDADLALAIDLPRLVGAGAALFAGIAGRAGVVLPLLPERPLHWRMTVMETGIVDQLRIAVPASLLQPADSTALGQLPRDAGFGCALGLDLSGLDDARAAAIGAHLPGLDPTTLRSLRGTLVAGVVPSAPLPALVLLLPRSPALDAWAERTVGDGARARLDAGCLIGDGVLRWALRRLPGHILLSSDLGLAVTWTGAGFSERPEVAAMLAQRDPAAVALGWSEGSPLTRILARYNEASPVVPGLRSVQAALLVALAGDDRDTRWQGRLVARDGETDLVLEAAGLVGSGLPLGLLLGLSAP